MTRDASTTSSADAGRSRLLAVDDVAERLGLSAYTVRGYLRAGKLDGVRVGGAGPWRVRPEALDRFLACQPVPGSVSRPRPRPVSGRFARQADELLARRRTDARSSAG